MNRQTLLYTILLFASIAMFLFLWYLVWNDLMDQLGDTLYHGLEEPARWQFKQGQINLFHYV